MRKNNGEWRMANGEWRMAKWVAWVVLIVFMAGAGGVTTAHADACVYTVRAGDTLSVIAQQYNTTVQQLALVNRISNVNIIYVNQRLVIPSCTETYASSDYVMRFPPLLRQNNIDLSPIPAAQPLSSETESLAKSAAVRLLVSGLGAMFQGSGSVIGQNGDLLLTAYHVVARPMTRELRGDMILLDVPQKLTAEVVGSLPTRDLALLRLTTVNSGHLRSVPIGDSDALQIGDTVYVVGYPSELGGGLSLEGGVVLDLLSIQQELRYIVTDAYAGQGSSGGLAINQNGELIGIVDALLTSSRVLAALGYPQLSRATVIVPINQALPLLEE